LSQTQTSQYAAVGRSGRLSHYGSQRVIDIFVFRFVDAKLHTCEIYSFKEQNTGDHENKNGSTVRGHVGRGAYGVVRESVFIPELNDEQ
jgi:hypothetical protein